MGEIADMMTDGTLCQSCGSFIGEPQGHPRTCRDCQRDQARRAPVAGKSDPCPICSRRFGTAQALGQHRRDTGH